MDEKEASNQGGDEQKLDRLGHELEGIEKEVAPPVSPKAGASVQLPSSSVPQGHPQSPPPSAPVISPQGKDKSRKVLWIGLALLLIALFSAGGYFLISGKKESAPLPTPAAPSIPRPSETPTPISTVDWQTYRNKEQRFELKYPFDWGLSDLLSASPSAFISIAKSGPTQTSRFDFVDGAELKLFPEETLSDEEMLSILESYGDPQPFDHEGFLGFRAQGTMQDGTKTDAISANKNGAVSFFWLQFDPSSNGLEAEKYLFPILSSFKFLDSTGEASQEQVVVKNDCVVGGCNNEICSDKQMSSICLYKDGYECYKSATCERQDSGECGWTQTAELKACLTGQY